MTDEKLIRWRCRRGMKELDVMLERFLAAGYQHLDASQRAAFGQLLDAMDPDLYAWLSGNGLPDDQTLQSLVETIRGSLSQRI